MILVPLLLSLIPMIGWGLTGFLAARLSRQTGALLGGLLIQSADLIFSLLVWPFFFSLPARINWIWLISLGFSGALIYYFFCRALETGKIQVVSPIISVWALFTAFFGIVFLGESFSFLKILSTLIILTGIVLLSLDWKKIKNIGSGILSAGVPQAMVVAVGWGITYFVLGPISRDQGWYFTTIGNRFFIVITLVGIFMTLGKKSLPKISSIPWKTVAWLAILDTLAFTSYNLAVSEYEVSYVSVISSASPLITALLAYVFLRERISDLQKIGMFAVIGGIILLQL